MGLGAVAGLGGPGMELLFHWCRHLDGGQSAPCVGLDASTHGGVAQVDLRGYPSEAIGHRAGKPQLREGAAAGEEMEALE